MYRLISPAKINIYLKIKGKALNGYHYLESIFLQIPSLYDELYISTSNKFSIETHNSSINIPTEENILYKCFVLIKDKLNTYDRFSIRIIKNIPIGGGLGGGSSNAGVFLRFISNRYNIDFSNKELLNIGADVPFFYHANRISLCSGFGEKVINIENEFNLSESFPNIILINPNQNVSTSRIFSEYRGNYTEDINYKNYKNLDNDLEFTACQIYPSIKKVISFLHTQNDILFARMSGSGSSCFGVFKSDKNFTEIKNFCLENNFWHHVVNFS